MHHATHIIIHNINKAYLFSILYRKMPHIYISLTKSTSQIHDIQEING